MSSRSGDTSSARSGAGRAAGRLVRLLLLLLVPILLVVVYLAGSTVQAGYVGVVTTFGRVEPGVLQPGFHLVIPGAQRIVRIDTRVQPHSFKDIDAASREYQSVKLTGTMNYRLEQARASELYQNVGLDFAEKVIDPAFSDFIKEVVPKYPVIDILGKRDEIRAQAREKLGENLHRYGIVVEDIYISNITFSPEYQAAIERKQTAQQNVETENQLLAAKRIQSEQVIVEAEAQAKAQIARANGESQANLARTSSITPQLIEYLRWTKWDGRLPMVTGDTQPLLQVPLPTAESAAQAGQAAGAAAPTAGATGAPAPQTSPTPQRAAPTPTR